MLWFKADTVIVRQYQLLVLLEAIQLLPAVVKRDALPGPLVTRSPDRMWVTLSACTRSI